MKLSFSTFDLKLKHVFTIARGSSSIEPIVIVKIEHDGIVGLGEASPTKRYRETIESVIDFLKIIDLNKFESPFEIEKINKYLDSLGSGDTSAKCAIDLALFDWVSKKLSLPLSKYLGINNLPTPVSSFTIGIDTIEMIEKKVIEAENYPILKIKVGMENDREIIKSIRKITDKVLRVDANEGWTDKQIALEKIKWLEDQNVEFCEQPMPHNQINDIKWLREKINMPLIADESSINSRSIPDLINAFDGINIKLMKSGGICEAMKMIHTARAFNLKIMLGCMIESSIAISSAIHLSPLVDFADLDGSILTTNDPFDGCKNENGKLIIVDRTGHGAVEK